MVQICFVCLGNICRSPTAEAVMRHLVHEAGLDRSIDVESAGTGEWHVGEPRDRRSREVGDRRGMPLRGRARQFRVDDFARFDHVLAMDGQNLVALRDMAPNDEARKKVRLLRSVDPGAPSNADVPDPYHGGREGFELVFDICESACRALLVEIRGERGI